jgi:hypothetical protein
VANGTNSTGAHAAKASKDLSIADALRPIRIDPSGEGVWCEWVASAPLELRALEVSFAVRDLLLATQHVSTAYGEVGARCERLWPDATNRPRCDLHKLGLQDVYALDQAAIDSLQATCPPNWT